jgi:hypothetical protein
MPFTFMAELARLTHQRRDAASLRDGARRALVLLGLRGEHVHAVLLEVEDLVVDMEAFDRARPPRLRTARQWDGRKLGVPDHPCTCGRV